MADRTQPGAATKSKAQLQQERAERALKALKMRTMRVSYDRIAQECGYATRGAAHQAVQRELAKIPREAAKELRTMELEALDVAAAALRRKVERGDEWAIDRMLKIMDMRAKLTGLYEVQADNGVADVRVVLQQWFTSVEKAVDVEEGAEDEMDEGHER